MESLNLRVNRLYGFFKYRKYIVWILALLLIKNSIAGEYLLTINYSILIVSLLFVYKLVYYNMLQFKFIDGQIIIIKGVFSKTEEFIEYYRIRDFKKYQSFWMRLFGVMRITFRTNDKLNPKLEIDGLNKSDLLHVLRPHINKNRLKYKVFGLD